ncbi:MAG TPA: ClpXP protease specificity-enhancing factor SspB [Byssovorax sp.]|jgi:stringent starvation protein B
MPDPPRQLPPKKDVAIALLEGPSVYVHLDPRREGVQVPKWFTGQPRLVLQVGLNMAIPIPDLRVEEDAITCTLSFNRAPFWCRLPWTAIYALVGEDSRGMLWQDDVPPEVALEMQRPASAAAPAAAGKPAAKKGKPKLNAVDGGGGGAESKPKKERPPARLRAARAVDDDAPASVDAAPTTPAAAEEVTHDGEREAELRSARDGAADGEPSASPSRPLEAGKKPKRELPPYLRVIK